MVEGNHLETMREPAFYGGCLHVEPPAGNDAGTDQDISQGETFRVSQAELNRSGLSSKFFFKTNFAKIVHIFTIILPGYFLSQAMGS
jgi:hypothetical protein